ncbi:hypothetical protein PF010_g27942 [Phytophthora fragariae]|uniref:PLC-like phosphodiesterase n=1 Tax=Phytophthora fragariae TaxID=53985 RepID=A0A6G0JTD0_9STRA|nr:hypothetical protein PF010_g27942 [Phytophthora fragariae]KAE9172379.1 hypothetical protein PF004_g27286 [Phytophthora fragariae]
MLARRAWLAMVLATTLVALFSSSSAWSLAPHELRRLNDQEFYQRLLTQQAQMADDRATCEEMLRDSFLSKYLTKLPTFGGFQSCVNANIFDLYPAIENSKCDLGTLASLVSGDSKESVAFMGVLSTLLGGVTGAKSTTDLSATLSSWSTNSSTLQGFCTIMNNQAGPCIEALVPVIISLLESDAMCCHELNGYLEVMKLLVPTGQTLEETIFGFVNGIHQTMCTTINSDRELCSPSMASYLSDVVTRNDSLLGAIIFKAGVPLYASRQSDICSSLETPRLASGLVNSGSIPYYAASCCVSGFSSLLQSVDSVVTHLSGNSMAELFDLITGHQNSASRFSTFYPATQECSFGGVCAKPNFTLSASNSSNATSPFSGDVDSKTRRPEGVKCTLTRVCNRDNVCSEVCEAGTASIEPWVANAIAYQRSLSYAESLCYAELPGTHNSVITQARGYGNRDQLFNAALNASNADSYMRTSNQFLSLTDQLNLGARFLELDTHFFASSLREGHCSKWDVSLLNSLSTSMVASLKDVLHVSGDGSTVEWESSLIGCLPSLSGIRAEEQRLHNESLVEVASWLARNPNDLVVIYVEIGDEVKTFSKMDALLALYAKTFGDLVFTPSNLEVAGGDWSGFQLNDLIAHGKRLILVTEPEANDQMFYMREVCGGWTDIPTSKSGPPGTFFNETTNAGKIIRAFESELHYATLNAGGSVGGTRNVDTAAEPGNVNATSLPVFVGAGVNILAPDGLDGATMAAMVWTWASNEPTAGSTAVQLSAVDCRWHGAVDSTSISHVACVSSSNRMAWKVVRQGSSCPIGYSTGAPRLAVENVALLTVLRAEGGNVTAQLDVDLSSFSIQVTAHIN